MVKDLLPRIVRDRGIDLVIANGENSAAGFGITPALAEELFDSDERGHCVVLREEVPEGLADKARTAVENCPETALSLAD